MFPKLDYIKQLVEGLKFAANKRFVNLEKFAEDAKAKLTTLLANRPNWNQNDPTALDYVEGRTHWKESSDPVLVRSAYTFTPSATMSNGYYRTYIGEDFFPYTEGATWLVVFDGVEYYCRPVGSPSSPETNYGVAIGNTGLFEGIELGDGFGNLKKVDTGEPFAIWLQYYYSPCGYIVCKEAGEHTVEVHETMITYHALDPLYVPSHEHDASTDLSGIVPIANGGTGATTALGAMVALGFNHGTCYEGAATAAKTAPSFAGFKLHRGALVGVKFININTASNPTLNITNTGAKAIYNYKTNAAVVEGDMGACLHLFMYDGTNWVLLNPLT